MAKLPEKLDEVIRVNGECLQFSHYELGVPDTDPEAVEAVFTSCAGCEAGSSIAVVEPSLLPDDVISSVLPEEPISSDAPAYSSDVSTVSSDVVLLSSDGQMVSSAVGEEPPPDIESSKYYIVGLEMQTDATCSAFNPGLGYRYIVRAGFQLLGTGGWGGCHNIPAGRGVVRYIDGPYNSLTLGRQALATKTPVMRAAVAAETGSYSNGYWVVTSVQTTTGCGTGDAIEIAHIVLPVPPWPGSSRGCGWNIQTANFAQSGPYPTEAAAVAALSDFGLS